MTAYVSSIQNKSEPHSLKLSTGEDIVREYFGNYSGEFVYSAWMFFPVNIAPNPPEINGPSGGGVGNDYEYSFVATDPNLDEISYFIEWGDGSFEDWIGPYSSGEEIFVSHSWSEDGKYNIRAKAKDIKDYESTWSEPFFVNISNPPNRPEIIGPQTIRKGRQYDFTFTTTDPDEDDIKIFIDWGDGITDETTFFPSGADVVISHTWEESGQYILEFYAVDTNNAESEKVSYEITVPRSRESSFNNILFNPIFDMLLKIFYQISLNV
jgi:hypothetical protein